MRQRNDRIDFLRIMSAFFVVSIHVVTISVTYNDVAVAQPVEEGLNIAHNLSSWAVPVFFMISGFCILGNDEECTWKWVMRHIRRFVGILFTFGWFYALLERVYTEKALSIQVIVLSFLDVINGKSWAHMWYIYSIIGIYLVLPIIGAYIMQKENNVYYLSSLLFLFTILAPAVNEWLDLSFGVELPMSGYLFYVCAGAAVARCRSINSKYLKLVLGAAGAMILVYFVTGRDRVYSYTSLPVCLMALSIFILVTKGEVNLGGEKLMELSKCTLGIYLVHPLFLNLMLKLLHIYPLHLPALVSVPVTCIFIFCLSYLTVYILRKIPAVKWII